MSSPPEQIILELSAPFGEYSVKTSTAVPAPSAGQILVKIIAEGLNPADWKLQEFGLFKEKYPLVLGLEAAGIVEDVASDVNGFSKGDRVAVQAWYDVQSDIRGTFRRYLAVEAFLAVKTNYDLLSPPWEPEGRTKYVGKAYFVSGGASQVGLYVLQFAQLSGFNPIIATASLRNFDLVKSYGATHVLDRKRPSEEIISEITRIAGGPVDVVYDAISEEDTLALSVAVARQAGQLVYTLGYKAELVQKLAAEKGLQTVAARASLLDPKDRGSVDGLLEKLPQLLREGLLKPTPFEILPGGLNAVSGGLERLENGQVSGVKLVVRPDDTQV
ncbi:chaperonin 10-like protein [Fomes fomentarius]|nr:chaperonin 10-like protein [Fomes fomentarius]